MLGSAQKPTQPIQPIQQKPLEPRQEVVILNTVLSRLEQTALPRLF